MTVVVLDLPDNVDEAAIRRADAWSRLAPGTELRLHTTTRFPDLLERIRDADIVVTIRMPLRREILDYATRPRLILVPAGEEDRLVEGAIASQLGLGVRGFPAPTAELRRSPAAYAEAWVAGMVDALPAAQGGNGH